MDVGLTIHSTGRHTLQKKIVNFRAETRTALLCVQKKKKNTISTQYLSRCICTAVSSPLKKYIYIFSFHNLSFQVLVTSFVRVLECQLHIMKNLTYSGGATRKKRRKKNQRSWLLYELSK